MAKELPSLGLAFLERFGAMLIGTTPLTGYKDFSDSRFRERRIVAHGMPSNNAAMRLQLHCDIRHSVFTLRKDSEDGGQKFDDLELALEHASRMVEEETALTVFNEQGKAIIETAVSPPTIAQISIGSHSGARNFAN